MSSLMQWGFIHENRKTTLSPYRRVSKQFLTGKYGKFGGALTVITRGFSENVLHRRCVPLSDECRVYFIFSRDRGENSEYQPT
jgi:hypothetical protein